MGGMGFKENRTMLFSEPPDIKKLMAAANTL